jgi:hypothetical protein
MRLEDPNADSGRRRFLGTIGSALLAFLITSRTSLAQVNSGFPDGYDAVQAAPGSHKVLFENKLVRLLEVTVPASGKTEPMHHHRWPSFFLNWETGGRTPHVRYHRPDGTVRDEPSVNRPVQPGRWSIQWMNPEPMHAIEVIDRPERTAGEPGLLRIEIKCND